MNLIAIQESSLMAFDFLGTVYLFFFYFSFLSRIGHTLKQKLQVSH